MRFAAYSANHSRFWSSNRPRRGRERANAVDQILRHVGLGVELADPGVAERHQIEVVVLVGGQAVAADGLALGGGRLTPRSSHLPEPSIEPEYAAVLGVFHPHLAVDVHVGRRHHVGLAGDALPLLRQRISA